jgi:hypothetical protein
MRPKHDFSKTCNQMKLTLFHILNIVPYLLFTNNSEPKKNTSFTSSLVYLQTYFYFIFSSSILCCNHISNDHPQEDLAKFGHRSKSKLNFRKKRIHMYIFWLPSQVSTLYDDFRKKKSSNLPIFPFFSQKLLLYKSH